MELRALQDLLRSEDQRIAGLKTSIDSSRARLAKANVEKKQLFEELKAKQHLATAHHNKRISALLKNLHTKVHDLTQLTTHADTTALFEAYLAADEFIIERKRQARLLSHNSPPPVPHARTI